MMKSEAKATFSMTDISFQYDLSIESLHAFRVFSEPPKYLNYTCKPIENAVYCFYENNF